MGSARGGAGKPCSYCAYQLGPEQDRGGTSPLTVAGNKRATVLPFLVERAWKGPLSAPR
jgi:hypothetical protein